MQLNKLPLADTKAFSSFFLDYINQTDTLKKFYHRFPQVENFKEQIAEKTASFSQAHRDTLVSSLLAQYAHLSPSGPVLENIKGLASKNTFTITTGHQLNILTGPLYFIYKIVTVINACKTLKKAYPGFNFVPVYWMASEDHDYDEIKYFRLYGKKYVWQTDQQGAVGRFTTDGLTALLSEVPGEKKVFEEAYSKNKNLSNAVRQYVHALFKEEGLVVVDGDDHALKALFKPVMQADIVKCKTLDVVNATNKALEDLQYKTQVYCREINFFYLDNSFRSRIEKIDGVYQVVDSDIKFTEGEIENLIETVPEKFSPNVILRPLYQEVILPNLAYVGGPAEVVYWLQLKKVFDQHHVPFPILMPRNFAMVIEGHVARKLEKSGLALSQLFEEKNFLFNDWTLKNSKHDLSIGQERSTVLSIFESLQKRAAAIDPTLGPFVGAEGKRALKSIEKIESKLLRAEKRFQSDKLRQIETVKDALFPNGGLQERTDNFLNFYQQDPQFILKLVQHLDAFDFQFNVLTYPA